LISCNKENSVNPISEEQGFDSARFIWTYDTIMYDSYTDDLWVPDTNNIFVLNSMNNHLVRLNNGIKYRYEFGNKARMFKMIGSDINNGYLFGTEINGNLYKPVVWKWTGNNFVELPTNLITKYTEEQAGLYISPSEMWLAGSNGVVLKYNGNDFTAYDLPDSLLMMRVFLDNQNVLKILGVYYKNLESPMYFHIFKFENNGWDLIYRDTIIRNSIGFDVLNHEIIGKGEGGIYTFDGQNFHLLINYFHMLFIFAVDGVSLYNFIALGQGSDITNMGFIFHWNGNKWSKEIEAANGEAGLYGKIKMVNEKYYVYISRPYGMNITNLFIGRKK